MASNRKSSGATATKPEASRKSQVKRGNSTVKSRGAKQSGVGVSQRLYAWLDNHRRCCAETLLRLLATPGSSLLTWLVLGIAISLPAGLYVVLSNVEQASGGWGGNAKLSVYFKREVSEQRANELRLELEQERVVGAVIYMSSASALEEFKQVSGFGDILQSLPNNPLPSLLDIQLQSSLAGVDEIEALAARLADDDRVDTVQVDLHWVQRLQAFIGLAQQAVLVLAVLLAVAVLLVTGNTIRLAIESRRDEIVVIKLVGGTDAFVRRPLLYTGLWYGLGGALIALLIVFICTWLLSRPAAILVGLYHYDFDVMYLPLEFSAGLLAGGALLGLVGAWVAVGRHISAIEPK